jgi:glycosyltransferase involved in cell wall biosynthesis
MPDAANPGSSMTLETWLSERARPPARDEAMSAGRLAACLTAGLSAAATPRLDALARAGDAKAAIALAVHFARKGEFQAAAERMQAAGTAASTPGDSLLLAHCLTRAGRRADAQTAIDALFSSVGRTSDALLAAANLALPDGGAYLGLVNEIYRRAGLCEIAATKDAPFGFGRLTAQPAPPVEDPGNRVSVLMPAYNAAGLVATALESLLAQSWRNIEIVVVDDASTDGTADVADAFAGRDPRVVVLRQERNRGAYPARNAGLAVATGRFVTVHDADDWSHPQKIELQARHALTTGAPIVVSAAVRVLEDMTINFRAPQRTHILSSFPSFLFETRVVREVGGWDAVRMGADAELYSRLSTVFGAKLSDPAPDVPLGFMLSTPESLTGHSLTGIDSVTYGARRQYIEAYRRWHASQAGGTLDRFRLNPERRPFPAPTVFFEKGAQLAADDAFVFDFMSEDAGPVLEAMARSRRAGRTVAAVHWPRFGPALRNTMNADVTAAIAERTCFVVTPGERLTAERVIFQDMELVEVTPDSLPEISATAFVFLFDA